MFLFKLWYTIHCFTHIIVMVELSGISPKTKIKKRFLSFKNCFLLITIPYCPAYSNPLFSSLKTRCYGEFSNFKTFFQKWQSSQAIICFFFQKNVSVINPCNTRNEEQLHIQKINAVEYGPTTLCIIPGSFTKF